MTIRDKLMKCALPNCDGLGEIPARENENNPFIWLCRPHAKTLVCSFLTNRMAFEMEGKLACDLVG